jgi:multicomponent Na+:H+ antiporter subunit C
VSFFTHFSYWVTIFLLIAGLYIVIARGNLIKKLIGLSIFQTSVYLLYIAPGKLIGGTAPIVSEKFTVYSNPLALVVRIREAYGSIEEDEIVALDEAAAPEDAAT